MIKFFPWALSVFVLISCSSPRTFYSSYKKNPPKKLKVDQINHDFDCEILLKNQKTPKNRFLVRFFNKKVYATRRGAVPSNDKDKPSTSIYHRELLPPGSLLEVLDQYNNDTASFTYNNLVIDTRESNGNDPNRFNSQYHISIDPLNDFVSRPTGFEEEEITLIQARQSRVDNILHETLIWSDTTPPKRRTGMKRYGNWLIPVSLALGLLFGYGGLFNRDSAKKVAAWAKSNPWKSRFIIGGAHIVTGLGALALGNFMKNNDYVLSSYTHMGTLGTFFTAALLYPFRRTSFVLFKHSFLRQKMHDIVLFGSGAAMLFLLGNNQASFSQFLRFDQPLSYFYSIQEKSSNHENSEPLNIAQQDLAKVNKVNSVDKKPLSSGAAVLLTLLTLVAFVGLGYLLALLSCSIACGGAEGLAALVFIGGLGFLVFFLILAIRKIVRRHKKNMNNKEIEVLMTRI